MKIRKYHAKPNPYSPTDTWNKLNYKDWKWRAIATIIAAFRVW